MGYTATVNPESRTGLVIGSGYMTGQEMVDACAALVTDPLWEPGFDEVWDLTGSELDVTPDGLESMVESSRKHADRIGDSRCVFVVSRDGVEAVLRLFGRLTKDLPRTYHTARTLGEAEAWLGLEPGTLSGE